MNKILCAFIFVAAVAANTHITTKQNDTIDLSSKGGEIKLSLNRSEWIQLTWDKVVEVDALGRTVHSLDVTRHNFKWCGPKTMLFGSSNNASFYQFSTRLHNGAVWNVSVLYDWANQTMLDGSILPPHGIKFTIEVDQWPFLNASHMLRFEADLLSQGGNVSDIANQTEFVNSLNGTNFTVGAGRIISSAEAMYDGSNDSVWVSTYSIGSTDAGHLSNLDCPPGNTSEFNEGTNSSMSGTSNSSSSSINSTHSGSDNTTTPSASISTNISTNSSLNSNSSIHSNSSEISSTNNTSSHSLSAFVEELQRSRKPKQQHVGVEWLFKGFNKTMFYDPIMAIDLSNSTTSHNSSSSSSSSSLHSPSGSENSSSMNNSSTSESSHSSGSDNGHSSSESSGVSSTTSSSHSS